MTIAVHQGDCIEVMRKFADNSIDSVVCDPPYGLTAGGEGGFMGKGWDGLGVGAQQQEWHRQWAVEAYRVLKPGGYILAFGGARTSHRLACAIEDAGFEIRDSVESVGGRFQALQWTYAQGFPKSLNVSKAIDKKLGAKRKVVGYDASRARPNRTYEGGAIGNIGGTGKPSDRTDNGATLTEAATPEAAEWEGWGTALTPAHEPIVMGRKPLAKKATVASNVMKHHTGAINIDACRTASPGEVIASHAHRQHGAEAGDPDYGTFAAQKTHQSPGQKLGRHPKNLLLTHLPSCKPGECAEGCPVVSLNAQAGDNVARFYPTFEWEKDDFFPLFYCKKADKKEKEAGCEGLVPQQQDTSRKAGDPGGDNPRNRGAKKRGNAHPTVKPLALLRWMVRLVTPKDGLILDPFAGSGTTGIAALQEGFYCILIEKEEEYLPIIHARLSYTRQQLESEEE